MICSFFVKGLPRPKPRMSQRDHWQRRPCVVMYRSWADEVRGAWLMAKTQGRVQAMDPVEVSLEFQFLRRPNCDADNLAKGVLDALNGLAWPDDKVRYVPALHVAVGWSASITEGVRVTLATP